MGQLTWRADDELVDRVRRAAAAQQRSMNAYVTAVLDAATNPDLAGDEASTLRARLDRAGLLVRPGPARRRPDRQDVAEARARAGAGTPLSHLVDEGR